MLFLQLNLFVDFMRKNFVAVAFVVSSLLIISCGEEKSGVSGPQGAAPLAIEGFITKEQLIDDFIEAAGTIVPGDEVEIKPEINGRIVQLPAKEGQFVKKGELLVKLFDTDLQAQKAKIQAQLELAHETVKRLLPLRDKEGISIQDFDQAQLQVKLLEAELDVISADLSKTSIAAPFDGELGLKEVSEGAYATAGTRIYTLRNYNPLKLDFSVPEKYAESIYKGQLIKFKIQNSDSLYEAKVSAIESGIDLNTRNLQVRATIVSNDRTLLPGAFAEVRVPTATNKNVILVPTEAVIPSARSKVVIVSKNGKANFVPVKTGVRKESFVEITDGLSVGDTIAITGVLFLKPNAPITFSTIKD